MVQFKRAPFGDMTEIGGIYQTQITTDFEYHTGFKCCTDYDFSSKNAFLHMNLWYLSDMVKMRTCRVLWVAHLTVTTIQVFVICLMNHDCYGHEVKKKNVSIYRIYSIKENYRTGLGYQMTGNWP